LKRLIAFSLWLLLAAGCRSGADEAFRRAAPSVLAEAAGLDSAITQRVPKVSPGQYAPDRFVVESEGARALGVAKVFLMRVHQLPEPQDQELRYLRSRLVALGAAALELTQAELRAHLTLGVFEGIPNGTLMDIYLTIHRVARWEGAARARFLDVLLATTAAERLALGSSVLPDSHPPDGWNSVGVSLGWTKDSLATRTALARCEAHMSRMAATSRSR
jgi:hypothetical protein